MDQKLQAALARARATMPSRQASQASEVVTEVDTAQAEQAELHAEAEAALANNQVKLIADDPSLSVRQKIESISDYLTAKDDDFTEANRRFGEFKVYFAFAQNQATKLDLDGMEQLEAELKGMTKATIERIVKSLTLVQTGMEETEHLLEIAAKASISGQTLKQLRAAILRNETLISEINSLTAGVAEAKNEESQKQTQYEEQRAREIESQSHSVVRFFTGKDKTIAAAVQVALEQLHTAQAALTTMTENLESRKAQRRTELETSELALLRTYEGTEEDINTNLITTSQNCRASIQSAMDQVTALIKRAQFSHQQGIAINNELDAGERRVQILGGALLVAKDATSERQKSISSTLGEMRDQIKELPENDVERAILSANSVATKQRLDGAQGYMISLDEAMQNLEVLQGANEDARSRAIHFEAFIKGAERALVKLNTVSLPTTAKQWHMMLEVQHARQTNELGAAINTFNKAGQDITSTQLTKLKDLQVQLHKREVADLEDLTGLITDAADQNADYAQTILDQGDELLEKRGGLKAATGKLAETLAALKEITTVLAGSESPKMPEAPKTPKGPAAVSPSVSLG